MTESRSLSDHDGCCVLHFRRTRHARFRSPRNGYRVELRIVVWARDDAVKVPASSLVRYETGWAVYKVENGVAKRRTVEVGRQNGLEAEITNGLSAGDQIVVYPSDAVHDGAKVTRR